MDACVCVHEVLRLVVLPQYIISPATPRVSAISLPFSRILIVESAGEAKRAGKSNIFLSDQLFHRSAVLGVVFMKRCDVSRKNRPSFFFFFFFFP